MSDDNDVIRRIHALRQMSVAELHREWEALYGLPTRSRNKNYLFRRLAWRVQEITHGGLSNRAQDRISELAADTFTRARTPRDVPNKAVAATQSNPADPGPRRDPRLPAAGTVITRTYRGRELRLHVLDDGFELDGVHHRSLSAAARAVTGSKWNGRLFWGLTSRKRK
jgi:hypothetical protein